MLHPPEKTDFSPKEKIYDTYGKIKFSNEKNSHPFQKPIRNPKKLLKQKKQLLKLKKNSQLSEKAHFPFKEKILIVTQNFDQILSKFLFVSCLSKPIFDRKKSISFSQPKIINLQTKKCFTHP